MHTFDTLMIKVFFAYAIITPSTTHLFASPSALDEQVKSYLSSNDVQIQEYDRFYEALGQWATEVQRSRAKKHGSSTEELADVEMQEPPEKRLKSGQEGQIGKEGEGSTKKKEDEEKVVKTDKVLLGNKVSWAVAQAIGEVSRIRGRSGTQPMNARLQGDE